MWRREGGGGYKKCTLCTLVIMLISMIGPTLNNYDDDNNVIVDYSVEII